MGEPLWSDRIEFIRQIDGKAELAFEVIRLVADESWP